jgi:hypothetical protein
MKSKLFIYSLMVALLMPIGVAKAAPAELTITQGVDLITDDSTPTITVSVSHSGIISYQGDCQGDVTSVPSNADLNNIQITFEELVEGIYDNCELQLFNISANPPASGWIPVTAFTVRLKPVLAVKQPWPATTFDTTPTFTFSSTKAGEIQYDSNGDCSSSTIQTGSTNLDNIAVTFNTLSLGPHDNCRLRVRIGNTPLFTYSEWLDVPDFTIETLIPGFDNTPPTIVEVTAIPSTVNSTTASYVFETDEAGTINYSSCPTTTKTSAIVGENTITFTGLTNGTYNCSISVTDGSTNANESNTLTMNFTVALTSPDTTPPTLSMKTAISTPNSDTTPSFTFTSNEAGTITYSGGCSSSKTTAAVGDNYVTLDALSAGTYTGCKLTVTDASGNSKSLNIPSFKITEGTTPVELCGGYPDMPKSTTDSELCDAVVWLKTTGAMTGHDNGNFGPTGLLQRDQIAKISLEIFNLYDSTIDYSTKITDPSIIPADIYNIWATNYIFDGLWRGMITGYKGGVDAGYYRPARAVTVPEASAIIVRNLNESIPTSGQTFQGAIPGEWDYGFLIYIYQKDLFPSIGTYIDRTKAATRGQIAIALYRLHNLGKL